MIPIMIKGEGNSFYQTHADQIMILQSYNKIRTKNLSQ